MIQILKERVGQAAEHVIAQGLGLEKKHNKYRCPNYTSHKNGDRNPSMSWDKEALQFYCFTCQEKLDIYEYHKRQGKSHKEILGMYNVEENKPIFDLEPITKRCTDYLTKRKVTEEAIKHFKLKSYKGNIAFPYYEYGQVVGVKYREPKKVDGNGPKYLSIKGSSFGLFNKQNINGADELIICEGEIDCMILYQCGYQAVSVGTGAGALDKLFQQEKAYLEGFKNLIIASDNDEAGKRMDKAFISQFGVKAKIINKSIMLEKDINAEYYKYGKDKIMQLIESARVKIEGLRDLDKEPYKGVSAITGSYIPTGIPTIDNAINDLAPKCVTLISGRTSDGKSTFVNQVMANAVDNGNNVLLVSGEGIQELLINNFYKAVIGRNEDHFIYKKVNKRFFKEPTKHVLSQLRQWHKGKLTIFNKGDSELKTTEQLFDLINMEVKVNRQNLVIIDNLMSILSVEKASDKWEAQADFMQRCHNLAENENTHIILVLHPNKSLAKGSNMEVEQISGTQDLANKADNIICVRREHDEEVKATGVNGEIAVLKNRYFSELPIVKIHFEEETGLLLEIDENTKEYIGYGFKWQAKGDEQTKWTAPWDN